MNLKGKIAIVTGAASGIGKETSIELAKHGCTPVLVGYQRSQAGRGAGTGDDGYFVF